MQSNSSSGNPSLGQLYGQDHILRQLRPSLQQGRLAHAYLLVGPPHIGKMSLAVHIAQSVNCLEGSAAPCGACGQCERIVRGQHADVRIITVFQAEDSRVTRTVIGIGDIKEALHQVNLMPYEGSCSVLIFDGVESMSEEAANALLKTLEEPPPQVLILLLTANEEALLPTIRSRCRRLDLRPVPKEQLAERLVAEHNAEPELAQRLARLSRGCPGWAINALTDSQILEEREDQLAQVQEVTQANLEGRFAYAAELAGRFGRDRESSRQTLYLWLRWWRDMLLVKEGAEEYVNSQDQLSQLRLQAANLGSAQVVSFIRALVETLEALDDNANPRLALEVLMLSLPAPGP